MARPRHEYVIDYGLFGQHSVLSISPSMTEGPLTRFISLLLAYISMYMAKSLNWNDLSPPPPPPSRFARKAAVDVLSDMRAALPHSEDRSL